MNDAPAKPTRVEPMIADDVSAPFWEATRTQQLVLQWCDACGTPIHYPRPRCPHCLGSALSWKQSSGSGSVYAISVMHQPGNPLMESKVPYAVALVDLDDGVRMLSNIVGEGATAVTVGTRVHVAWEPLSDGKHLPVFEEDATT